MKTCKECKKEKPINEFYKHPAMDGGHLNKCKECKKEMAKKNREENIEYYREYDKRRQRESFKRVFLHRYSGMKSSVEGRNSHNRSVEGKELCSKEEFLVWCAKNIDEFRKLHQQWQKSGYEKSMSPSVDRIDNDKGYIPENMQWITLSENSSKDNSKTFWKNFERDKEGQFVKKG